MSDFHPFDLLYVNIYSDLSQSALKNTEANINNVLIMTEDFNIRDSIWDLLFSYYSSHSNILINIANSLNLYISKPTN